MSTSGRGYICLDRGIFTHEFFPKEKFSKREAWIWMLTEAAWKGRDRRVGKFKTQLHRGQFAASYRHMARTWSWSLGNTQRYIDRLVNDTMIDTQVDTGIMIITICNYNKYQLGEQLRDTLPDTSTDTPNDTTTDTPNDTIQKKVTKKENILEGPPKVQRVRRSGVETTLPTDFVLEGENQIIAAEYGFYGVNAQRLFDKFCSHAMAKGKTFVVWKSAWRQWCIHQAEWDAERNKPPQRRLPDV